MNMQKRTGWLDVCKGVKPAVFLVLLGLVWGDAPALVLGQSSPAATAAQTATPDAPAAAQTPSPQDQDGDTRAGQINAARDQKAALIPQTNASSHGLFGFMQGKLMGMAGQTTGQQKAGVHLRYGGLVPGAGIIAAGPEVVLPNLAGLRLRASGVVSTRKYQKYDFQLTTPSSTVERAWIFDIYGVHRNYPSLNYYGPGPDSPKGGRSDYRLEDSALTGTLEARLAPHLYSGASLGYLLVNVGPGTDSRFISTDKVYGFVPGVERQSNFMRLGGLLQYDYRDHQLGTRRGGNYRAVFSRYMDRKLDLHDFYRAELQLEQYIPFFNEQRVIALRAASAASFTRTGQTVPFYLQPTLGGADNLRGYRSYRFTDDDMMLADAEYRWEAFSGLEMGIFADAGKVFPQHSAWNLKNLESDVGVGARFNVHNNVYMRLDLAFSHEGFQFWFRLNDAFVDDPVRPPLKRAIF